MAVSLREYRARIKSTESMKKITRAMELIAASRIIKAQQRAQAAAPYARELTRAVSAVATFSNVDHPLTKEEENPARAAVLFLALSATVLALAACGAKKDTTTTSGGVQHLDLMLDYLRRSHDAILASIRDSLQFGDDTEEPLIKAYDSFVEQFETSEGGSIHVGDKVKEEAMEDDELEQEQIVKQKRS